jgi:flagellar biosynthesis component FlhA
MLCAEISQYSFNLSKVKKMIEVNEAEVGYYRQRVDEMKQETIREYKLVDSLKQELAREKIVLKNTNEYDRIAETINKYSSRAELQRYIIDYYWCLSKLDREIDVFQNEAANLVLKQGQIVKLVDSHKKTISENFASLSDIIEYISDDIKRQSK